MSSDFLRFVSSVKQKLGSYPGEQAVSIGIVLPVLKHLGWDVYNPGYVCPEYPLDRRKVDYGLKIFEEENKGLRCIIEVKAEGNLDADQQLFQYAFIAGVPLAVLTDGKSWRFYLPMTPGSFEERLVRTLDFGKHKREEIIEGLERYLSFRNTRSGKAVRNAERDRTEKIKRKQAENNISLAWEKLLGGSSDKLITLLIEETSQISPGYAPAQEDVETFLRNFHERPNSVGPPSRIPSKSEPKPTLIKTKNTTQRKTDYSFRLFGNEYSGYPTAASAFVKILEILAGRDQSFLARLAHETAGRKYRLLSMNKEDLGPLGYKVAKELPGAWWVSTHSSSNGKIQVLKKACGVARIPFGKPSGLKVNF